MIRNRWSVLALAVTVARGAWAQTPSLPVHLPNGRTFTIPGRDLAAMALDTISASGHNGVRMTYRAVALTDLLRRAGVNVDSVRGPRTTWVVVATASDGFRSTFSLGELAEYLGPTRAFLATSTLAGSLSPSEGPYRLLVPTDKRGSRAARQVVRLDIVDARPGTSPQ